MAVHAECPLARVGNHRSVSEFHGSVIAYQVSGRRRLGLPVRLVTGFVSDRDMSRIYVGASGHPDDETERSVTAHAGRISRRIGSGDRMLGIVPFGGLVVVGGIIVARSAR